MDDGQLTIAPARPEDVDAVLGILEQAAAWLMSNGVDQWITGSFSRDKLATQIGRSAVYLAKIGATAVGTMRVQWSDPVIWGERPDDAGYVHALAVLRACAGQGLGLALLRHAEAVVAQAGKPYLRLDCMRDNPSLRAYYEQAGFTCVGEAVGKSWSAALYQKRVGEQSC